MRLLALATSSVQTSVFAGEIQSDVEGFLVSASVAPPVGSQANDIYRCIDQALDESKLSDVDVVAFDAGPGAFTGIRIGCGVAQGLGFGKNCGVIAIDGLEALANASFNADGSPPLRLIAIDARMGEVYYAAFEFAGFGKPLKVRLSARVGTVAVAIENFEAILGKPASVALIGNAFEPDGAHIDMCKWGQAMVANFRALQLIPSCSHAQLIAVTASRLIRSLGLTVEQLRQLYPAMLAEPIYVRNKVALDKTEQAQLRAAHGR
jgi:tRNA threonylcarbamoyladenosine biosynthesis protein TsaB